MSVVLMYHSLYQGNDTSRIDAEDLPYAVSSENFIAQLNKLQQKRVGLLNAGDTTLPEVIISFDDGHLSNLDIAVPLLKERNMNAYMFVTSDFVGKRPHFCRAEHLQEMVANGMEIGSHGQTHRFFDDLSDEQAECELRQSLQQLADQSGQAIRSISYPGGRYSQRTLEISRNVGLTQLFGSDIGLLKRSDMTGLAPLKRVAIRRSTTLDEFDRIINADRTYYAIQKTKQQAKTLIKRSLGNRLYHGLYKSISAR